MEKNKTHENIGQDEKEVAPCRYDKVKPFIESFARIRIDGKWGTVNENGEESWD